MACLKRSKNEGKQFPSSTHDHHPCVWLEELLVMAFQKIKYRTDLLVYRSLDEMREGGHSIEHTKENSSGK
jgi:hypothetical protein